MFRQKQLPMIRPIIIIYNQVEISADIEHFCRKKIGSLADLITDKKIWFQYTVGHSRSLLIVPLKL